MFACGSVSFCIFNRYKHDLYRLTETAVLGLGSDGQEKIWDGHCISGQYWTVGAMGT